MTVPGTNLARLVQVGAHVPKLLEAPIFRHPHFRLAIAYGHCYWYFLFLTSLSRAEKVLTPDPNRHLAIFGPHALLRLWGGNHLYHVRSHPYARRESRCTHHSLILEAHADDSLSDVTILLEANRSVLGSHPVPGLGILHEAEAGQNGQEKCEEALHDLRKLYP